jgi:hypothetical protein
MGFPMSGLRKLQLFVGPVAEIDPDFAGRKIMLAVSEDGRSLATDGPRLVVPRDRCGGRTCPT